jgi:hypothetical protein
MPFTYPPGHEWRVVIAHSPPGTLFWLPMRDPETGRVALVFVLREDSDVIQSLPQARGSVFVEWRFGLFGLQTQEGKVVAFLDVMVKTPGGISEANINVLHMDEETISIVEAEDPITLVFFGDSGKVERQVIFPVKKTFRKLIETALQLFREDPWTDAEYDAVKAHFQDTTTLEEAWEMVGQK